MAERNTRERERREFLRYDYKRPFKYKIIQMPTSQNKKFSSTLIDAISKNLSASGIYFVTKLGRTPTISNLLVMNLDYKTAGICKEIEDRALILKNKLIGRVVRMEDNGDGTCGIGVAFITRDERLTKNIESLLRIP